MRSAIGRERPEMVFAALPDRAAQCGIRAVRGNGLKTQVFRSRHNRRRAAHRKPEHANGQVRAIGARFNVIHRAAQILRLEAARRAFVALALGNRAKVEHQQGKAAVPQSFGPGKHLAPVCHHAMTQHNDALRLWFGRRHEPPRQQQHPVAGGELYVVVSGAEFLRRFFQSAARRKGRQIRDYISAGNYPDRRARHADQNQYQYCPGNPVDTYNSLVTAKSNPSRPYYTSRTPRMLQFTGLILVATRFQAPNSRKFPSIPRTK